MTLSLLTPEILIVFLLLTMRIGAIVLSLPLLGSRNLPAQLKVLLILMLGSCPRINTHPSVGVGLSAWMSPLALFCWLGYHLNTARGDVPDALPTLKGPIERHVGGSDELKPSSRHVHSATA